ncbi:TRAP transporter small permease subunit [Parahaliea mediterranea]|uniref:TRAP transporter small permease protein n=1 Tax=Parahaliea mediterranea TaxID=651086 RepID=A0A939IKE1_9GAMM|nr:TRAP transporter small permease subunit [Parahaliea mediterranea]MBN7797236.1 TRAP transporter small permease subunit [Parahaliea mediterranea]
MSPLRPIIRAIDNFTDYSGRALAWLAVAMALLTTLVVLLRYGLNMGSIAAQEAITYMHGTLFTLGAAYTLRHDGHVRVDIFYRRFTPRTRAWINSLGGIVFLLPLCVFLCGVSWNYVAESWSIRESSPEPGGIPAVFLLKSLLPLMAATLFLQALAETLRNTELLLRGDR